MTTPTHRADEEVDTRHGELRNPEDRSDQPGQGANPAPANEEKQRELDRAGHQHADDVLPPRGDVA